MSALQDPPTSGLGASVSTVRIERVIDCPFSFCLEDAHLVFAELEAPGQGVRLPLRDLGLPFGGSLRHRVSAYFHRQPDLTERGRPHDEVQFNWNARSRWLPNFRGVVRMRIENLKTRVVLEGDYVPPLGTFGAAFDRFIGVRLARASGADIFDRFAQAMESRWALEKRLG